jgi:hypothetical protein
MSKIRYERQREGVLSTKRYERERERGVFSTNIAAIT